MRNYSIAVIPGDGIGAEVMPPALSILDTVAARHGFGLSYETFPWGCEFYARHGQMMDKDGLDKLAGYDAILLGAVGYPGVPDHISLWGLLIPIRRAFHQYINLRPIRLLKGVQGPLANKDGKIDILIVRENNEGEYSEAGGRLYRGTADELAIQESIFTRRGIERAAKYAATLAKTRSGSMVGATKSNGIIHTMPFWDEVCTAVAQEKGVGLYLRHIDALAADFVLHPERLDVVVASNLFGDILSDLGAAVAGSIGIAPSANLNPEGEFPSMFEPVHGSAPDIAGQGIANPMGQIWSASMMLDHLNEKTAAADIMGAIETTLATSPVRTRDLGGTASTLEFAQEIKARLGGTAISGASTDR
jgi:tartrate dehydrogenase/decarboxylase/D-malate dehydrogenase